MGVMYKYGFSLTLIPITMRPIPFHQNHETNPKSEKREARDSRVKSGAISSNDIVPF